MDEETDEDVALQEGGVNSAEEVHAYWGAPPSPERVASSEPVKPHLAVAIKRIQLAMIGAYQTCV
jgi:hypothetical protein